MDLKVLREQVHNAKSKLTLAEQDLTDALGGLEVMPRASKTHIGGAIERAFQRLRDAKLDVAALEHTLLAGEIEPKG